MSNSYHRKQNMYYELNVHVGCLIQTQHILFDDAFLSENNQPEVYLGWGGGGGGEEGLALCGRIYW